MRAACEAQLIHLYLMNVIKVGEEVEYRQLLIRNFSSSSQTYSVYSLPSEARDQVSAFI
jgi:cellobiose phosphorylase